MDCMQQSRDPINDTTGFLETFPGLFQQPREYELHYLNELILILIMLPKIRVLAIGGNCYHCYGPYPCRESENVLRGMLESAAKFLASHTDEEIEKSTHPLLQLQELHINSSAADTPRVMVLHPGLTTLYWNDQYSHRHELHLSKWSPSKNLQHIHCRRCLLNTAIVRKCIVNCPGLETLRLHWVRWGLEGRGRNPPTMDYSDIGRHLRQFGLNIKVLQLQERIGYGKCSFTGRVGPLRELGQLVELKIDYDYFVVDPTSHDCCVLPLVDVVPPSLERLELSGCTEEHCVTEEGLRKDLLALLASKNASKLRSVRITGELKIRGLVLIDTPEFNSTLDSDVRACGWNLKQTQGDYLFFRL